MKTIKLYIAILLASILTGITAALFMHSLNWATHQQQSFNWLLWLLPLGGAAVALAYHSYAPELVNGTPYVVAQIRSGHKTVPYRLVPLVIFGTLITHLFGGSAGREGTAMQIGGGTAGLTASITRLPLPLQKLLLLSGLSAGFGALFGTPLAAAIFAIESAALPEQRKYAILPCLTGAFAGHYTFMLVGSTHALYPLIELPALHWQLIWKLSLTVFCFAVAALSFRFMIRGMKKIWQLTVKKAWLASFLGGLIVIALVYIVQSRQYLGLGLPIITAAFDEIVSPEVFALKLLFTAVTVGSGFIGGDVTPLFASGAALGSSLAAYTGLAPTFTSALGLPALFGAVNKAPLAAAILGAELFGWHMIWYLLPICLLSSLLINYPKRLR